MLLWIVVSVVASALVSVATSFLLMRRYSSALTGVLESTLGEWNKELETIRPTISKAYGILSAQGTTPRQLKTAEKYFAEDILENTPDIKLALGVLETVSPRAAEYLQDNPEILPELLEKWWPKIQAITGAQDIGDLLQGRIASDRGIDWAHRA